MTSGRKKIRAVLLAAGVLWIVVGNLVPVTPRMESAHDEPSLRHPLGVSPYGHDLLLWCATAAAKTGLQSALASTITLALGLATGCFSALRAGKTDDLLLQLLGRLLEALGPLLVVACVLSALPKISAFSLTLFLALASWPVVCFVVRNEILRLKHCLFVEAAVVIGSSPLHLISRYYLPAMLERLVPLTAALFASFVGVFGALAFLGLGISATDSLGFMIFDSQNFLQSNPIYFISTFLTFISLLLSSPLFLSTARQPKASQRQAS
jgi:nickel transport system permease protein